MGSTSWFVAFPGKAEGPAPRIPVPADGVRVVHHPSGRPWIVADASHARLVVAGTGARRLALFGEFDADAGRLARLLDRHDDVPGLLAAAHRVPGSFHLICADGDALWVQGSASGLRQVCYARHPEGGYAAADSVEPLIDWSGGAPRPEMVAWGLVHPGFDYGLTDGTHWTGVHRLPADHRLRLTGDRADTRPWWRPPTGGLPLAEGAPLLRAALEEAVAVRVRTAAGLSADLSGGMDSTSLCYLLAGQDASFRSFVEQTVDPNHDDARWAALAAREIGRELTVLGPEDVPGPYDGIWDGDAGLVTEVPYGLGEPYTLIRNRTRKTAMSRLFAATGATVHIGGFGGDELFTVAPSYFSDLYRTAPVAAVRGIRPLARLRRWTLPQVVRSLADRRTYAAWFTQELSTLHLPRPATDGPTVGWGPALHLPPWATAHAAEAIREIARERSGEVRPQAGDRASHTAVAGQRIGGQRLGPLRDLMERSGVLLSLPYMDDHVLEAALAVPRGESLPGRGYKPLLKAAMGPTGSGALSRSTKGEFSMSVYRGLQRNRRALLAMVEEPLLAEHGLVDPDALRASIRDTMRPQHETAALELTLGAEAWLRTVAGRTTPTPREPGGILVNSYPVAP
ncbi:asparagine synthase-related protein [Kitasatospora sp. NPDC092286]|uniref:asparagine synthase-related protein n=1 Tax=Kitasatospora sp. NPDC092286 TaxID=3364087 RepID=UPI003811D0AF